jgi:phosphohistidine phosphatase
MGHSTPSGTRQLWILRHAKAADAPRGGRDVDRALADRGRSDAEALGVRLATEGPLLDTPGLVRPEVALCSAAARTIQTAELVLGLVADRVPLDAYRSLYEAGPATVLTYLREVDEQARSALVVGHNPTMFHLAWDLLVEGSADRDRSRTAVSRPARWPSWTWGSTSGRTWSASRGPWSDSSRRPTDRTYGLGSPPGVGRPPSPRSGAVILQLADARIRSSSTSTRSA